MYQIRLLEPHEASVYREIRLEALNTYPDCFAADYEQQKALPTLYFERLIKEASTKGKMAGAFINAELVGICGVTFETTLLPDAGEIIQMYVKPTSQHLGIGRALMRFMETVSLDCCIKTLVLGVEPSNKTAFGWYQGLGYRLDQALSKESNVQYMKLSLL